MGKHMTSSTSTSSGYNKNNLSYIVRGRVDSIENDSDPLHKVDIVCSVQGTVTNNTSNPISMNVGDVSVYFGYGSESITIKNSSAVSVSAGRSLNLASYTPEITIGTIDRGAEASTVTIEVRPHPNASLQSLSLKIPPLKQNATYDGKRIVSTVDGVKYDLLNFK